MRANIISSSDLNTISKRAKQISCSVDNLLSMAILNSEHVTERVKRRPLVFSAGSQCLYHKEIVFIASINFHSN